MRDQSRRSESSKDSRLASTVAEPGQAPSGLQRGAQLSQGSPDGHLAVDTGQGSMVLGTWQGIYVVEHRDRPHRRNVAMHFIGTLRK